MNWFDVKEEPPVLISTIKEPPCKECENFKPRRTYNWLGAYDGVSICSAETMFRDFSCYEPKEPNEQKTD